jgi:lipopolysaccharide export system permease protein
VERRPVFNFVTVNSTLAAFPGSAQQAVSMKILSRYIIKEFIGPFTFAIIFLTFVLMMNQLVLLFNRLVGKGLDTSVITEVFLLSIPFILASTIPMALLVATMAAFGRLANDNELVAMRACGISPYRIIAAPLVVSAVLAVLMFQFNDRVLPETNHRLRNLLLDISLQKPTIGIQEGRFVDEFPGYNILAEKVDMEMSKLYDITIYDRTDPDEPRTIIAKEGDMRYSADERRLIITLYDGEIHAVDPERKGTYRRMTFKDQTLFIKNTGGKFKRREGPSYRGDREMSTAMLLDEVESYRENMREREDEIKAEIFTTVSRFFSEEPPEELDPFAFKLRLSSLTGDYRAKRRRIAQLLVEAHKKYAIAFACIVFVLVGVPLRMRFTRGGIGLVITLSVTIIVFYYICLTGGENLADRMVLSPFWAMWTSNVILLILGLILLILNASRKSIPWPFIKPSSPPERE